MLNFSAADRRAKATIKACVESGAGIEYLPDAPRFRYTPAADKPLHSGPPSVRRLNFKRKPHMLACKNWSPPALTYGPADYRIPMAGDDWDLTEARGEWSEGRPGALRQLLAERAKARASAAAVPANELCIDLREAA